LRFPPIPSAQTTHPCMYNCHSLPLLCPVDVQRSFHSCLQPQTSKVCNIITTSNVIVHNWCKLSILNYHIHENPAIHCIFTRATLCYMRGIFAVIVCLCVCPSVTSRCPTKKIKPRNTQTTPCDSPGTPVFWCQKYRRNSKGVQKGHP